MKFAEPRRVERLEECWFYHVMDLPQLGTVNHFGSWDLRGRFADYTCHVDVRGKTFLDIGAASGFLSFEAERHGAIVTSFDVATGDEVNVDAGTPSAAKRDEVVRMQNGYWLAHRLLDSRARAVYGDAMQLSQLVEPHDVVILGQILVHMREPIALLEQAAKVAKETLIIAEGSFHSKHPTARYWGTIYPGLNSYWHLSDRLYAECLNQYGFDIKRVRQDRYRCNHPASEGMAEIWTFVAQRRRARA